MARRAAVSGGSANMHKRTPIKRCMVCREEIPPWNKFFCDYGQTQMTIIVDPRVPNKWREQPYLDDIRKLAHLGLSGEYDFDFQTVVRIGRHRYLILPHGEIDISNADDDSE